MGEPRHRLVYGTVNEDPAIEEAALPATGRLVTIASGGDVALRLAARGAEVTAVDVNPAQIQYVRQRLGGGPPRPGSVERMQRTSVRAMTVAGWRRAELERFCALADPAAQLAFWRRRLNTRRLRFVLALSASPASIRAAGFAAFTSRAGMRFDVLLRTRFERGIARHPNRDNPFVRRMLLGALGEPVPVEPDRVRLVCDDVLAYLRSVPAGSVDGFSLSNVLDAADDAYRGELCAAVRRAAAPGATVVTRSFRASDDDAATERAAQDRSMLWGAVRVERAAAMT